MNPSIRNPFQIVKANDYNDPEINKYWVDFEKDSGFEELIRPKSFMPIILTGGKGCGKTHLMRYFSFSSQRGRYSDSFHAELQKDGYLGIYFKCGALDPSRFTGNSIDDQIWEYVYSLSFDLRLAQILLNTHFEIGKILGIDFESDVGLSGKLWSLINDKATHIECTAKEFANFLNKKQKEIDYQVNNSVFSEKLDIDIFVNKGDLIFGISRIIQSSHAVYEDIRFLLLIDEIENLTTNQQRYLQSLIRDRVDPVTFRVGARTYGVKTYQTLADGEENKPNSEFEPVILDAKLREKTDTQYKQFATTLCLKRLSNGVVIGSNTNIDFEKYFEAPNDYNEFSNLPSITSGENGKSIKSLIKLLNDHPLSADASIQSLIMDSVRKFAFEGMPLLEKLAILEFFKKLNSKNDVDYVQTITDISLFCSDYKLNPNDQRFRTLKETFSKVKSDLFAQLHRDHNLKVPYAGFAQILQITRGFPRDLLTMLKFIYRRSVFEGILPFESDGAKISISSQNEGIREASNWYFQNSTIEGDKGVSIKASIERLATIFRQHRFCHKPPESSLVSFYYVDDDQISNEAKLMIELAEKWSFILLDPDGRKDSGSKKTIGRKYRLNPLFSPHWELPVSERGSKHFSSDVINAIFSASETNESRQILMNLTGAWNFPFKERRNNRNKTAVKSLDILQGKFEL